MVSLLNPDTCPENDVLSFLEHQLGTGAETEQEAARLTVFWTRLSMICAEAEDQLGSLKVWSDPRSEEVAHLKLVSDRNREAPEHSAEDLDQNWLESRAAAKTAAEIYANIIGEHAGGAVFVQKIEALKKEVA